MRFYVGVTEKEPCPLIEGAHEAVIVSIDVGTAASSSRGTLSAISHFPPFSLVLATPDAGKDLPHPEGTELLRYGADDPAEALPLELPVVRVVCLTRTECESARLRLPLVGRSRQAPCKNRRARTRHAHQSTRCAERSPADPLRAA